MKYRIYDRDHDAMEMAKQNVWASVDSCLESVKEALSSGRHKLEYLPWTIEDDDGNDHVRVTGMHVYLNKTILIDPDDAE